MRSAWTLCAVVMLATALVGQTSTAPKSKKKQAAPITAADVQSLKDAIAAQQAALTQQQQQIQELRDQLRQKDQAVQQVQSAATDATSYRTEKRFGRYTNEQRQHGFDDPGNAEDRKNGDGKPYGHSL
jgi:TolA-binding protein